MIFILFIFSLSFAGNCPEGHHWVSSHTRRAYIRFDGTFVSASKIEGHCRSNPPSYKFWEPKLRSGRPKNWPFKNEKEVKWTEEDKERFFEAVEKIPNILWSGKILEVVRLDKSNEYPNPATSREGTIALFNSAFDKNRNLSRIITHELAH